MKPRQLFLFVEGDGDKLAVPVLLKRLLKERGVQDQLVVAPDPFVVGEYPALRRNNFQTWKRYLETCLRKYQMETCLLLIDGDAPPFQKQEFCAKAAALDLARVAKERGAGRDFTASIVIATQEFESWLIAGAASLAGKPLPGGSDRFSSNLAPPAGDIELNPRNAKGFFKDSMSGTYRPTLHQASMTTLVDIETIRARNMRSFRRLEHAPDEIMGAVQTVRHIVSPVCPS